MVQHVAHAEAPVIWPKRVLLILGSMWTVYTVIGIWLVHTTKCSDVYAGWSVVLCVTQGSSPRRASVRQLSRTREENPSRVGSLFLSLCGTVVTNQIKVVHISFGSALYG